MGNILENCEGFEWDDANSNKNWLKHKVTKSECEQVFFNKPLIIADDEKHSVAERRWLLLGKTDMNRKLFVVFTLRKSLIRVISARNMSKKEREIYNEEIKKNTEI
jgi:uncharacterized DUF497 family protein